MFDTQIKNARYVNSRGIFSGNIYIKDGKIAAISDDDSCEAKEVIDAGGYMVIPGVVDEHVHMMDPGYTDREDFMTGSRAAAVGGITTVMEHHRTDPPVISVKELEEKKEHLKNRSVVDFCLKGGCTPENVGDLEEMWNNGVTGFKLFTCELHHQPALNPGALYETFIELKRLGATALIHAEDDSLTHKSEELLKKAGRNDYLSQNEWRSALAEEVAVEGLVSVAREVGNTVIVAHCSMPRILEIIDEARNDGYPVYAETCPHYFYLSTKDLEEKGPWVKFAPAVRDEADAKAMWKLLELGKIETIGSDHCPFPYGVKEAGVKNIWDAPNGIPGIETSLMLMLNGVNEGKVSLEKVIEVMCENPAKRWNLYPKKGVIAPGADADIVFLDMNKSEVISNDRIVSKCGWSPFDGFKATGVPVMTMLRGKVIMKDREILVDPGYGQFVPRQY